MRITFTQRATDFEMYAPDAFARSVGGMVNFTVDGFEDRQVRLIAAEVAPDGKSVEVTVDVPREAFPMCVSVVGDDYALDLPQHGSPSWLVVGR